MERQLETQQDGGPPETSQGPLAIHHKVLDRQIRLWGLEAQRKLLQARVLMVGLSAINVEASKDLALAGVSQTLCDGRPWKSEEICFNFLPALATSLDPSCTTAEASRKGLETIASFVSFASISPKDLGFKDGVGPQPLNPQTLESVLQQFTCVCIAAEVLPAHTLGQFAAACRKWGVGLIVSQCCGGIGFFLQDFGTYELVRKDEGGKAVMSHPALLDSLNTKLGDLDPKVDPAVFAVLALLRLESQQQKIHKPLGSSDPLAVAAAEIEQAAAATLAAEGVNPNLNIRRALRDLASFYNQQTNATAAVVGGLLAQEIRKFITKEQKAVPNVVVFDSHASCATVASVPHIDKP